MVKVRYDFGCEGEIFFLDYFDKHGGLINQSTTPSNIGWQVGRETVEVKLDPRLVPFLLLNLLVLFAILLLVLRCRRDN